MTKRLKRDGLSLLPSGMPRRVSSRAEAGIRWWWWWWWWSLFRIVHARGDIPNEVGPARCRATPAWRTRINTL